MTKKQQALTNKLGSWADQASLTRQPATPATLDPAPTSPAGQREQYAMAQGLMDRIADTATRHGLTQSQLIGYLLTWALDQVESGVHVIDRDQAL
jgi:hypothetical protein